jgi:hypothetical protein
MAAWVRLNSQLRPLGILVLIFANLFFASQLTLGQSASARVTVTTGGTTACQFMSGTATAAFCESVVAASPGGRAGDLDNSR